MRALAGHSVRVLAALPLCFGLLTAPAAAGKPQVGFDVGYLIACRDITPPEFALANPGEMLLEAVFDISTLMQRGEETELAQVLYRLQGEGALAVVDHLPRTEFASEIAGPIQIERRGENSAKLGGDANGEYPGIANANVSLSAGSSSATTMRYELLPPQELVAASGTVHRGRGVYFKLKPSPRESLEGARQFVCVFRAPINWRMDLVQVDCRAECPTSLISPTTEDTQICGQQSFQVGLYLEGDVLARRTMSEFLHARERLFAAVRENRERLEARLFANDVPGWGRLRALLGTQSEEQIVRELDRRRREQTLSALALPADFELLVEKYCVAGNLVREAAAECRVAVNGH